MLKPDFENKRMDEPDVQKADSCWLCRQIKRVVEVYAEQGKTVPRDYFDGVCSHSRSLRAGATTEGAYRVNQIHKAMGGPRHRN